MKGNDMNKKIICLAALLPLAACQQELATNGNPSGKTGTSVTSDGKDFRGLDPASIYPHLADSVAAPVDSIALSLLESKATEVAIPKTPLKKQSAGGWVKFCTAANLLGTCATVNEGTDYNDLRFLTPWGNDAISSMDISPGASLYLCDANNWGGPCYFINQHVNNFQAFPNNGTTFNFNDKVTSFKWQLAADGDRVYLFDSPNYLGDACVLASPFDFNYPPCNFNDRTSSYQIVNTVNSGDGVFSTGASWTLSNYIIFGGGSSASMPTGWNNVISSWRWLY